MSRAIELLLADQTNTKQDWKIDWTETSKLDFILEEPLEEQDVSVILDTTPSTQAQFTPGIMWFGTGNPATHYCVSQNATQGLEIAVKIHQRGGAGYAIASDVDADGYHVFNVPALPLLTVSGADNKRATWNISYSILAGQNDIESSLSDFSLHFGMDLNPASSTGEAVSLDLTYDGAGKWVSNSDSFNIIDPDSSMNARNPDRKILEQNSFNIGITKLNPYRPQGISATWAQTAGEYKFIISAKLGGKEVLKTKVKVKTSPTATWV